VLRHVYELAQSPTLEKPAIEEKFLTLFGIRDGQSGVNIQLPAERICRFGRKTT
jgi:hypothetical protein